jgi:uncharacterized damage-inducible protein DinB
MAKESKRLAEFSEAVRESTLKRLKEVPPGKENWRLRPDSLSFVDLAQHLIDADQWVLEILESGKLVHAEAKPGMKTVRDRSEYDVLIRRLVETQAARRKMIEEISGDEWDRIVEDPKFGSITVWWAIVRGSLDHEIHHRGQIAVYLKSASLK